MQVEISERTYGILRRLSEERGDASPDETLDNIILRSQDLDGEVQRLRGLVDEGIRSASEEPLVDGEAFFQQLRERRTKAA